MRKHTRISLGLFVINTFITSEESKDIVQETFIKDLL